MSLGLSTPPAALPPAPSREGGRGRVGRPAGRRRWFQNIGGLISPERILRSTGVRFGVIYAGLFGVSALALAGFLWWSTAGLVDRQTDAAINADLQGLSERYQEGGVSALVDTIRQRVDTNVDDDAIYLLVDRNFHPIAGNLDGWPEGVTMDTEWGKLRIDHGGMHGLARVHYFDLDGGYHLLIGRDVQARTQMRQLLGDALLWAAGIAVALGSIGAWAVRGLFRATLADISSTATAISAGDLSRRVRVTGLRDEFDMLAETINDMLDRIARLMDGVRQVSNAIAHDLRTPITRARTRVEDAATHSATADELRAALERGQADLGRHRGGVPGAAAHFRNRGGVAPVRLRAGGPRAAVGGHRGAVRRGGGGGGLAAGADCRGNPADLRRPRHDPAGGGQPARQRAEVLAAGQRGRTVRHRRP